MNHILAFLRLCQAAQEDDQAAIGLLLSWNEDDVSPHPRYPSVMQYNQILLPLLDNGTLTVAVPIQVALKCNNSRAASEILVRSLKHPVSGMIDWHGLELDTIPPEWLKSLDYTALHLLCLSFNQLKQIPGEVSKFKNLEKLQVASNELSFVPSEIFCLEQMENIDLSYNHIASLPEALLGQVSQSLRILNLSNNQLVSFPDYFAQSKISHLDLSKNRFQEVPESVSHLRHLESLNFGKNYDIKRVPYELGGLRQLKSLALDDVPNAINIPDKQRGSILKFLQDRFKSMQTVTHYEVQVIGFPAYSKTVEGIVSVVLSSGLKCNVLKFNSALQFLFLFDTFHLPNVVYLVPWDCENLQSVNDLHLVLRHLSIYAPDSPVIVAACWKSYLHSHSELEIEDQISNSLWKDLSDFVLLHHVLLEGGESSLGESGETSLETFISSIDKSSKKIKTTTFVPSSYYNCGELLKGVSERFKTENRSMFVSEWDFWELVRSMPSHDLSSHCELPELVKFLCSMSSVIHLPCPKESQPYYVLDRQWYCHVLGNIISQHSFMMARNTSAIVRQEGLVDLLGSTSIHSPIPCALQYVLNRSGISMALSSERWLVPSMLGKKSDYSFSNFSVSDIRRQYTFSLTPMTLMGRLITHLLINMERLVKIVSSGSTVTSSHSESASFTSSPQPGVVDWTYWRDGIICWKNACDLVYSIEKIDIQTEPFHEAIEIRVPNTSLGFRTMQLLTFIIDSLLKNWYPTVWKTVEVWVPCSYCIYTERSDVPSISFQDCLLALSKCVGVRCVQHTEKIVTIAKIVPDLVQEDIRSDLFFPPGSVTFNSNDKSSCISPPPTETVFKGMYNEQLVAIKPYPSPVPNVAVKDSCVQKAPPVLEMWMEFEVLLHLGHDKCPFILNMVGMCPDPLCLIFPFAKWSSLEEVIGVKEISIPRLVRMRMVYQLAIALEVLHSNHVIHRNVSLSNILVYSLSADDEVNVKLSGFSDACYGVFQGVGTGCYGTFPAPEMLQTSANEYDERVDIFAFGFVSYEIITRSTVHVWSNTPFQKSSSCLLSNDRPSLIPVRNRAPHLCELLNKCWNPDPFKRPFASKILEHLRHPLHTLVMDGNLISKQHEFYAASAKFTRVKNSFHADVFICSGELTGQSTAFLTHLSLPELTVQRTTKLPSEFVICMGCVGSQLWVSFFGKKVRVYSTTNNLDLVNEFSLNQHVVAIGVNPTSVYLGLDNGVLQIYDIIAEQNTPTEPRHTKVVTQGEDFKSIEPLEDSLICATKDAVYRLHPDTLEREAKWMITAGAEIRSIVISEVGAEEESDTIWISFRRTDQVQVLDAWQGTVHYTISCSKIVDMESDRVWVYSMRLVLNTVWIGLNTGHILVFASSADSPTLITHFKVHNADVRQLLLLHPSYMGPSTILSANELLKASGNRSLSGSLGPGASLNHAVTFPESVLVLSLGTGLIESLPQMSKTGEIEEGSGDEDVLKKSGLFAVVLEGMVESKLRDIEDASVRQPVLYMNTYNDQDGEVIYDEPPLESSDEEKHVHRVDTWSAPVKESPVHSKFPNLAPIVEANQEYVIIESALDQDVLPPPLPPRPPSLSTRTSKSSNKEKFSVFRSLYKSKPKSPIATSCPLDSKVPIKETLDDSLIYDYPYVPKEGLIHRAQTFMTPPHSPHTTDPRRSTLDSYLPERCDSGNGQAYDPYVSMDAVQQSLGQPRDLRHTASKARARAKVLKEKKEMAHTEADDFVTRDEFFGSKKPPLPTKPKYETVFLVLCLNVRSYM